MHQQHILALDARFTDLQSFTVNRFKDEQMTTLTKVGMGLKQGFNSASADYFDLWFEGAREYLVVAQRLGLEHDVAFRQILPYTVLAQSPQPGVDHASDVITAYQRTNKIGESRLAGDFSIGAGGHIDVADLIFDDKSVVDVKQTIFRALLRELIEEFIFVKEDGETRATPEELLAALTFTPAGFIRDDANTVGRVHLGLINVVYFPTNWVAYVRPPEEGEEAEHLDAGSGTPGYILSKGSKFENWSQILLEEFAKGGVSQAYAKPAAPGTVVVITEPGETASMIALQFDANLGELVRLNPVLANSGTGELPAGTRLWITDPEVPQPTSITEGPAPLSIVVREGETVNSIAANWGVTSWAILTINQIKDPAKVHAGMRLYLRMPSYVMIRPGDTVESIAARWGLDASLLSQINRYGHGNLFTPGRLIRLVDDNRDNTGQDDSSTGDETSGLGATILGTIGRL